MPTTSAPKLSETTEQADEKTTFQGRVTQRNAITLPAELRQALHIEAGDTVELEVSGDQFFLRRPRTDVVSRLQGILRPYFKDHEDVMQFLEEERSGLEERDAHLEERWEQAERARVQVESNS